MSVTSPYHRLPNEISNPPTAKLSTCPGMTAAESDTTGGLPDIRVGYPTSISRWLCQSVGQLTVAKKL